ncbi:TPA_asm: hypothetical protein vir520_00007 [Caudoviricetes sp. vir520]|nr:TPA_asm: hypothetical protein vir520_00007 [Caudoviricetes sp. vir520]
MYEREDNDRISYILLQIAIHENGLQSAGKTAEICYLSIDEVRKISAKIKALMYDLIEER